MESLVYLGNFFLGSPKIPEIVRLESTQMFRIKDELPNVVLKKLICAWTSLFTDYRTIKPFFFGPVKWLNFFTHFLDVVRQHSPI